MRERAEGREGKEWKRESVCVRERERERERYREVGVGRAGPSERYDSETM